MYRDQYRVTSTIFPSKSFKPHTLYSAPRLALYGGAVQLFLRASISSSDTKTSILLFWTSTLIMSPFLIKPIGPPSYKINKASKIIIGSLKKQFSRISLLRENN